MECIDQKTSNHTRRKGKVTIMAKKISGGLLQVLKSSTVAWYRGTDGTQAYYEQPTAETDGVVAVNGRRVCRLHVDPEGLYWDRPSPPVQRKLLALGVDLNQGWTGPEEVHGVHINEAMQESRYEAVRHHNGRISVQKVDEQRAVIFVNGNKHWTVKVAVAHNALEELGVETWTGWYPVQQNLLSTDDGGYRYRRELI